MFFAGKICWKFVVYKPVLQEKTERYKMKITPGFDNGVPFLNIDSIWNNFNLKKCVRLYLNV